MLLAGFVTVRTTAQDLNGNQQATMVTVDNLGTVHIPAHDIPVSIYMSTPAKEFYIKELGLSPVNIPTDIVKLRESGERLLAPLLERAKSRYPSRIEIQSIAGVRAIAITPLDGQQFDTSRVLINLHGGGFRVGSGALQLIESLPIAATARIRVISIDYSLSPEHKFPAASEDVAAVYRELIKHFLPAQIGIYGCSSGGMLTAMSVAWFQREKLPRPGAIGIFCSGLDYSGGGDSAYIAGPLQPYLSGVKVLPPPPNPNPPAQSNEYLGSADPRDPMVSPGYYPDRISQFPPTLIVTGTRDDAMSSAVHAHAELDRAGVQTELHVWEGMWHGFFFNVDLPESQEMYKVTSRFFNAHLETSH